MTLTEARHHVGRLLGRPEYLRDYPLARAGLRWITAGTHRVAGHEAEAEQFVDWLHEKGPAEGIRPISEWERARAAGLEQYCRDLGLEGQELFDAVGLSFDGYALMRRMAHFLRDWGDPEKGGYWKPSVLPDPMQMRDIYRSLDSFTNQIPGLVRVPEPFPPDLCDVWYPKGATAGTADGSPGVGPGDGNPSDTAARATVAPTISNVEGHP